MIAITFACLALPSRPHQFLLQTPAGVGPSNATEPQPDRQHLHRDRDHEHPHGRGGR